MKKVMFAAAAAASMLALGAGVESGVVGYTSKETRGGANYVTPPFINCDSTGLDINAIQIGEGGETFAQSLQILGAGGQSLATYFWATATDLEADKGAWVDDEANLVDVPLEDGAGVMVQTPTDSTPDITFSGAVSDSDVLFTTRGGANYVGNPFPFDTDINAIQIGDGGETFAQSLQILGAGGQSLATYFWATATDLEAEKGAWVDDEANLVDVDFNAGDCVMIQTPEESTPDVIVEAPFTL